MNYNVVDFELCLKSGVGKKWYSEVKNSITKITMEPLEQSEICSKLTIKTPEQRHWRRYGVFIVNFEHISHFFLVLLLLTLNI